MLARKHANSEDGASSMEIRVAVIGNVDSGKSTMVGVLTRSILDDGRGFARSKVFKHGHEEATGRTSSIGQHNLCVRPRCVARLVAHGRMLEHDNYEAAHCTCATGYWPHCMCLPV